MKDIKNHIETGFRFGQADGQADVITDCECPDIDCPQCLKVNDPLEKFCTQCGLLLDND